VLICFLDRSLLDVAVFTLSSVYAFLPVVSLPSLWCFLPVSGPVIFSVVEMALEFKTPTPMAGGCDLNGWSTLLIFVLEFSF